MPSSSAEVPLFGRDGDDPIGEASQIEFQPTIEQAFQPAAGWIHGGKRVRCINHSTARAEGRQAGQRAPFAAVPMYDVERPVNLEIVAYRCQASQIGRPDRTLHVNGLLINAGSIELVDEPLIGPNR